MGFARQGLKCEIGIVLLIILGLLCSPLAASCTGDDTEENRTVPIGIDIGSGYSRVAYARNISHVDIISDKQGHGSIPSCVAFTENGTLVGYAAQHWSIENPDTTICNPRALIGRQWSDQDVQAFIKGLPYEVSSSEQDKPVYKIYVGGETRTYEPEEVMGLLIGELKRMAETAMEGQKAVAEAVIAVPKYFTDEQRDAMKVAARLAGVEVLLTPKEPVAIAVAYEKQRFLEEQSIVVVDLGDTLDVSVLHFEDGYYEVLATSHHDGIGAKALNRQLSSSLAEIWEGKANIDLTAKAFKMKELAAETTRAILALSVDGLETMGLDTSGGGFTRTLSILRPKFDEIVEEFSIEIVNTIRQKLKEAELEFTDSDELILAGGLGQMPKIVEAISREFPSETLSKDYRSEAAVIGAARMGAVIFFWDDSMCNPYIPEFSPFDLGIETIDGYMAVITPQCVMPCSNSINITTAFDNQSSMLVRVLQGQRILAVDNMVIGELEIPVEPGPASLARVEVLFQVTNQAVRVTTTDLEMKKSEQITIDLDQRLHVCESHSKAFCDWPSWETGRDSLELGREVEARFDLESYLTALWGRISDPAKWGVEDVTILNHYGQPVGLAEVRRVLEEKWGELIVDRGIRELKDIEGVKEMREFFSRLTEAYCGEFEYEIIHKVGGKTSMRHDEL